MPGVELPVAVPIDDAEFAPAALAGGARVEAQRLAGFVAEDPLGRKQDEFFVAPGAFNLPVASPYTGGADALNLPTLTHGACYRSCTFTRTFKLMPGAAAGNYSVQASFTDAPGATITPSVASFNSSACSPPR